GSACAVCSSSASVMVPPRGGSASRTLSRLPPVSISAAASFWVVSSRTPAVRPTTPAATQDSRLRRDQRRVLVGRGLKSRSLIVLGGTANPSQLHANHIRKHG